MDLSILRDDSLGPDVVFVRLVASEVASSRVSNGPYRSVHEAYGVIAEEVAELFDLVRQKPSRRDPLEVVKELVQVAACCVCGVAELEPKLEDAMSALARVANSPRVKTSSLHDAYGRVSASLGIWARVVLEARDDERSPAKGMDDLLGIAAACQAAFVDLGLHESARGKLGG